jgi:hypothetical protein
MTAGTSPAESLEDFEYFLQGAPNGPHEARSRDWQHRRVARMHKVRQWYPSEQRHKVIYRGTMRRSPADKPLLGGETVRALVR